MRSQTTVLLIRHGEVNNPRNVMYGANIDLQLNDVGRRQIRKLAKKIKEKGFKIEKIYTSPLSRAKESARILVNSFDIKDGVIVEDDLRDTEIPVLAGKPKEIRFRIHKRGTDEYSEEFVKKGNEPRAHVVERMRRVFNKVFLENRGRTVAIIGHGDPLQFLIYTLTSPGKSVPTMNVLANRNYPQKGEAIKIVMNNQGKIIEKSKV